jgi:hypothetical protein
MVSNFAVWQFGHVISDSVIIALAKYRPLLRRHYRRPNGLLRKTPR